MCLTCGARARLVVTVEADHMRHGRMAGKKRMDVVVAAAGSGNCEDMCCSRRRARAVGQGTWTGWSPRSELRVCSGGPVA